MPDCAVLLLQAPLIHEYPTRAATEVFPVSAHGSQVNLSPEEVDFMSLDSFSTLYGVSLCIDTHLCWCRAEKATLHNVAVHQIGSA